MVMFLLIGLLMAVVIVIFLLIVITVVRFRRRHGITQPLMWWDPFPTRPSDPENRSIGYGF
jgi:hypothetical protein